MDRDLRYKIIIGILFLIIFIQTGFILKLSFKKRPPYRAPRIAARIAIVLDDWGYNLNSLEILKDIKQPLTLAILPHLEYSQAVAGFAKKIGKEAILHLPLEPKIKDYQGWEKFTITTDMPEEKIREIVSGAVDNLGGIKGVSNHMGSKATENDRTMAIIFKELKKRGLYFLDSQVTPHSICEKVAHDLSLKFIKRDIFLDNKKDAYYIRNQLNKLKLQALKKGWAVGIGHDHRLTLEVLKEEISNMEKEGFKFVFLSELVDGR